MRSAISIMQPALNPATVRMILNGQMAKAGPPMDGRDLHIGDFDWGIVPASAPLSISSLTAAARGLPALVRRQNNQTALSTPGRDSSAARVFAEKAAGYGIPGLTIDGTDP